MKVESKILEIANGGFPEVDKAAYLGRIKAALEGGQREGMAPKAMAQRIREITFSYAEDIAIDGKRVIGAEDIELVDWLKRLF